MSERVEPGMRVEFPNPYYDPEWKRPKRRYIGRGKHVAEIPVVRGLLGENGAVMTDEGEIWYVLDPSLLRPAPTLDSGSGIVPLADNV